ncbi:MAG: conjugal transfer protein TraX [Alphaproteobacteria bacterium]|nr:conjugal transfer protein TraX [Alphaproteobacteria bacterium]
MIHKALPVQLTSYDILKALAVVLMVADHIGAYFLPDVLWLRVAGRLCVPMWFFLIGYARSRDLDRSLWWGALLVILSDFITGRYIFPLNILVTILGVRLVLDVTMKFALKNGLTFWLIATLLTAMIAPSAMLMQYGTQGLLLAGCGWLLRHIPVNDRRRVTYVLPYMIFCTMVFTIVQWSLFRFSIPETAVLLIGLAAVMATLHGFYPFALPRLTQALPMPVVSLIQMAGRHTLLIYVVHLLLIKALGLWLYPAWFSFLGWELFPPKP